MKKGNIVKIKDGSYMATINSKGKLTHTGSFQSTRIIGLCHDDFLIIQKGLKLPSCDSDETNNTILFNLETKEIWFANSTFNFYIPKKEKTILTHNSIDYSEATLRSIIDKFTK